MPILRPDFYLVCWQVPCKSSGMDGTSGVHTVGQPGNPRGWGHLLTWSCVWRCHSACGVAFWRAHKTSVPWCCFQNTLISQKVEPHWFTLSFMLLHAWKCICHFCRWDIVSWDLHLCEIQLHSHHLSFKLRLIKFHFEALLLVFLSMTMKQHGSENGDLVANSG